MALVPNMTLFRVFGTSSRLPASRGNIVDRYICRWNDSIWGKENCREIWSINY